MIERFREKALKTTLATAISLSASGVMPSGTVEASDMFDVCAGDVVTVEYGDSLWSLAQDADTTTKVIIDNNDEIEGEETVIKVGDRVCVPTEDQARNMSRSSQTETSDTSSETGFCEDILLTSWVSSRIAGSNGDRLLDDGTESQVVQTALNKAGFNVGFADGVKGGRTLRGFYNFQKQQYGEADCLLGSDTYTDLNLAGLSGTISQNSTSASNEVKTTDTTIDIDNVVIDKSDNVMFVYDGDVLINTIKISRGDDRLYTFRLNGRIYSAKAHTRTGKFTIFRTEDENYASRTLGGRPGSMGRAKFFSGGLAIHAGDISGPSHGCVRVYPSVMKWLDENGLGLGDLVTVQE